ncbi:MAG: hypothetical protein E7350_01275 [Clostridiales bacterium]|nr:hypothetical protein [Clostridiales bacterium]
MTKLIQRLKGLKHKEIIIAVVSVVVMLVIYFSSFGGSASKKEEDATPSDYCLFKQQEISDVISQMEGAGKASVVINWASSVEIIPAQNVTENGNTLSSSIVLSSGEPIILKEIYPRAIGVLIVCEGGSDARVRVNIIMAVSTLLDLQADKILVYGTSK